MGVTNGRDSEWATTPKDNVITGFHQGSNKDRVPFPGVTLL